VLLVRRRLTSTAEQIVLTSLRPEEWLQTKSRETMTTRNKILWASYVTVAVLVWVIFVWLSLLACVDRHHWLICAIIGAVPVMLAGFFIAMLWSIYAAIVGLLLLAKYLIA